MQSAETLRRFGHNTTEAAKNAVSFIKETGRNVAHAIGETTEAMLHRFQRTPAATQRHVVVHAPATPDTQRRGINWFVRRNPNHAPVAPTPANAPTEVAPIVAANDLAREAQERLDQAEAARILARRTSRSVTRSAAFWLKRPTNRTIETPQQKLARTQYEHSQALNNFATVQAEQELATDPRFANRDTDPTVMGHYHHEAALRKIDLVTNGLQRFTIKEIEGNQQKGRLEKAFEWWHKNSGKRTLISLGLATTAAVATAAAVAPVAIGAGALYAGARYITSASAIEGGLYKAQDLMESKKSHRQNLSDAKISTLTTEEKADRLAAFMETRVLKGEKVASEGEQKLWQALRGDISHADHARISVIENLDTHLARQRNIRAVRWTVAGIGAFWLPGALRGSFDFVKDHLPTVNIGEPVKSVGTFVDKHTPNMPSLGVLNPRLSFDAVKGDGLRIPVLAEARKSLDSIGELVEKNTKVNIGDSIKAAGTAIDKYTPNIPQIGPYNPHLPIDAVKAGASAVDSVVHVGEDSPFTKYLKGINSQVYGPLPTPEAPTMPQVSRPTLTAPTLGDRIGSSLEGFKSVLPSWLGGEELEPYYFREADPRQFDKLGHVIPNGLTSSIEGRAIGTWAQTYVAPELGGKFDDRIPAHIDKLYQVYERDANLNKERIGAMIDKLQKLNGHLTIPNNPDEFPHTVAPNDKTLLPFLEPKDKKGFFEAVKLPKAA